MYPLYPLYPLHTVYIPLTQPDIALSYYTIQVTFPSVQQIKHCDHCTSSMLWEATMIVTGTGRPKKTSLTLDCFFHLPDWVFRLRNLTVFFTQWILEKVNEDGFSYLGWADFRRPCTVCWPPMAKTLQDKMNVAGQRLLWTNPFSFPEYSKLQPCYGRLGGSE